MPSCVEHNSNLWVVSISFFSCGVSTVHSIL
uniref:Uncharacterized protein n=1 Tax=Rhizophora mucronata TaxID=61149 RepID=A0A2P2NHN0_RHIMU